MALASIKMSGVQLWEHGFRLFGIQADIRCGICTTFKHDIDTYLPGTWLLAVVIIGHHPSVEPSSFENLTVMLLSPDECGLRWQ